MRTRVSVLVGSLLVLGSLLPVDSARASDVTCTITYTSNFDDTFQNLEYVVDPSFLFVFLRWPPSREEFQFVGWNTEQDGTGVMYDAYEQFPCPSDVLEDEVFAQWVSIESLHRTWNQTLTPTSPLRVGETIYASAFERHMNSDLVTLGEAEEYVYRITKQENIAVSSVDLQSRLGYTALTAAEQDEWYERLGFSELADDGVDEDSDENPPYEFSWFLFLCFNPDADTPTFSNPRQLTTSYVSMEDGLEDDGVGLRFSRAHKKYLRYLVGSGLSGLRTTVGDYNDDDRFLMEDGTSNSVVLGSVEVGGDCGDGTLDAFPLVDSDGLAVSSKSFDITAEVSFFNSLTFENQTISSDGVHIGVTGEAARFNAALWGLARVGALELGGGPVVVDSSPSAPVGTAPTIAAVTSPKIVKRVRISGFAGYSDIVTPQIQGRIGEFVRGAGRNASITCIGSTSGDRVTENGRRLALRRAQQACALVRKLRPGGSTEVQIRPSQGIGPRFRNVTLEYVVG